MFMNTKIITLGVIGFLAFTYISMSSKEKDIENAPSASTESQVSPLINEDLTLKNVDILIANQGKESIDRLGIIKISRAVEACTAELVEVRAKTKNSHETLISSATSEFVDTSPEMPLMYLVNKKVLNVQTATTRYENWVEQQWKQNVPSINGREVSNNQELLEYMVEYSKLANLLSRDDLEGIKSWFDDNQDKMKKQFYVTKGKVRSYTAINALVTQYFGHISFPSQNWLLENMSFDAVSVARAIEAKVPVTYLKELLKVVEKPGEIYFLTSSKPTNLLTTALLNSDLETLEFLLTEVEILNSPLLTSPMNLFMHEIKDSPAWSEEEQRKLQLLAEHGITLDLWVDNRDGVFQLHGFGGEQLSKSLKNKVSDVGIRTTVARRSSTEFSIKLTPEQEYVLDENIERFKSNYDEERELESRCTNLKTKRLAMEPKYKDGRSYAELVEELETNQQKLEALAQISPTLADLFITSLLTIGSKADYKIVDDWLLDWEEDELTRVLHKGDLAMPHQQSYLAAKLCNKNLEDGLLTAVTRGWYMNPAHAYFDDCRLHVNHFEEILDSDYSIGSKVPSAMYSAIQSGNMTLALKHARTGDDSRGFTHGRDALLLMLDRIVPFRARVTQNDLELIELLLHSTPLVDNHFRRLNRLELKLPTYFDGLKSVIPELGKAKEYKVNDYVSYI